MSKKIYVGNMNYATTEDQVRSLFAEYGDVASVKLVTDRETGKPKGFGFVEMADDSAAQEAISSLNGLEFDGRALRVNEAFDRPKRERRRF